MYVCVVWFCLSLLFLVHKLFLTVSFCSVRSAHSNMFRRGFEAGKCFFLDSSDSSACCQLCKLNHIICALDRSVIPTHVLVFPSRSPQMTAARQPAAWTWPTGWPIWSRGCRCRRTRSSCWRWRWPTSSRGSTSPRSTTLLPPLAGGRQELKVSKDPDYCVYLHVSLRI